MAWWIWVLLICHHRENSCVFNFFPVHTFEFVDANFLKCVCAHACVRACVCVCVCVCVICRTLEFVEVEFLCVFKEGEYINY